MKGTATFKRGRYTLILWSPVRLTWQFPDEDGWHMIGWAWTWSRPKRWTFPREPDPTYGIIMQGVTCGPIDLRRTVKRLAERIEQR